MLSVYIDFKSPASYLALEPTIAMIEETSVETRWLPFSSRPFMIPSEKPNETVGERHRRVRALSQQRIYSHYAQTLDREMRFPDPTMGSDAALAALTTLEGDAIPFIKVAFDAYWTIGTNLTDEAAVAELLRTVASEPVDFPAARQKLEAMQTEAIQAGVFETPTYHIDDQIFIGREHLPWIRSIIDG